MLRSSGSAQPLAWPISRNYSGALREWRMGDAAFVLSICLAPAHRHPREAFISWSGSLNFVAATRGHLYISWAWWPKRLMLAGPTRQ